MRYCAYKRAVLEFGTSVDFHARLSPVSVLELGMIVGGEVTQLSVPVFRCYGTTMSRTIFHARLYLGGGRSYEYHH